MQSQGISGIDRGGGDAFRWRHAQMIAGQRRIIGMLTVGLVPGLKSVASATIAPAAMSSRQERIQRVRDENSSREGACRLRLSVQVREHRPD